MEEADRRELTRSVSFEVAHFRVLPQGGETRKPRPQAWGAGQTTAESPNGARLFDSCEVVFPSRTPLGLKREWVRRSPGLRPGLSSLAPLGLKTATKIAAVQCRSATSKSVSEGEP